MSVKGLLKFKDWAKGVVPTDKFDPGKVPPAPDYTHLRYWAAYPGKASKAHFKPQGVGADDLPPDADVFYIHPTSYFGRHNWNYGFKHFQATELINEILVPMQAGIFNGCCRIFVPYYRQATFATFLWATNNGRAAMEVAYGDLLKAFEHYIEYENQGRPFFIASHSQGSCHAMRLLEEVVDKTELAQRLVAAYVVGFRLPEEKFVKGHFTQLRIGKSPTDTGCILTWDTYADTGKPMHLLDRAEIWYPREKKWRQRSYRKPAGVNPLSWRRDQQALPASLNLGAVGTVQADPANVNQAAFGSDTPMNLNTIGKTAPQTEEVSAQLRKDGFLYVSLPRNPLFRRMMLPGGNLHNYDYTLFYMNIRENAKERLRAFLGKGG